MFPTNGSLLDFIPPKPNKQKDITDIKQSITHKGDAKMETMTVPTPEQIKEKIKTPVKISDKPSKLADESTTPSVAIIGCGGCGTNVIKLLNIPNATVGIVDTSKSNLLNLPNNVSIDIIEAGPDDAKGSGMLRGANSNLIQQNITGIKQLNTVADITIIIHSFSGGSGSVIGPLLANYLTGNENPVVVVGVLDTLSGQSITNTTNTIRTYQHLSEENDLYFPAQLFDNKVGRKNVDTSMVDYITHLVRLLTSREIHELDISDKKNFLRPRMTGDYDAGIYMLDIYKNGEISKDLAPVHGTMIVNENGDTTGINIPESGIVYSGTSDTDWYIATIGRHIDPEYISNLEDRANKFAAINHNSSGSLKDLGKKVKGAKDKSGLIL